MNDEERTDLQKVIKEPQFIRGTRVDIAFKDLEENLLSKLVVLENEQKIYELAGTDSNASFVEKLLRLLSNIHEVTCNTQRDDSYSAGKDHLLPISLQDMVRLESLINLIIIHGIEANVPPELRLPADVKSFASQKKQPPRYTIPKSHIANSSTLKLVISTLYPIFRTPLVKEDYVRSVMLKGPLYTGVLLAIISCISKASQKMSDLLDTFENLQQTYELFTIYTLFVRSIKQTEAHDLVLKRLSTLPIRRENGLISLIDFVTGAREDEQIDLEKINRVTQILVSKPKSLSSVVYFSRLFVQVYREISNINRPIVVSCLNDLICTLYAKNPRIIHDFLFKRISSILFNSPLQDHTSIDLNDMINVLLSLTKNPSRDLIEGLVLSHDKDGFYLHLWVYAVFLRKHQTLHPIVVDVNGKKVNNLGSAYYDVILSLLKSFIIITGHYDVVDTLSLNMASFRHEKWSYVIDLETQLAHMSVSDHKEGILESMGPVKKKHDFPLIFQDIDLAIEMFIKLLKILNKESVVKAIFLKILSRWIQKNYAAESLSISDDNSGDALQTLIDMKTLELLNKEFENDIIKNPTDVLFMIDELMGSNLQNGMLDKVRECDSDDEDDDQDTNLGDIANGHQLICELLFTILDANSDELLSIKPTLLSIDRKLNNSNFDKSRRLHEKIVEILENKGSGAQKSINEVELKASMREAISNINDPLESVKVQGLKMLLPLVQSEVLSIDRALSFHMEYLKYPDPFLYLNSIKGITHLCQIYPGNVLPVLLQFYLNKENKNKLDDVLKVGEVLMSFIQRENLLFQGAPADAIIDTCISQVRRYNDLDNKIRMSAVSILGVCTETNARGIQSRLNDILDCAFGILQLETQATSKKDADTFMVRRAAIHLIYDLIHKNGTSLLPEQYSPSKLKTLLNYLKITDSDPLVREQAAAILPSQ